MHAGKAQRVLFVAYSVLVIVEVAARRVGTSASSAAVRSASSAWASASVAITGSNLVCLDPESEVGRTMRKLKSQQCADRSADNLCSRLAREPMMRVTPSTVLKMAIARGLDALEAEYK